MSDTAIIVDLTNYRDRQGARVPADTYRVVVDDVELTESQAKNPMINVWFRILGGEFADSVITDRLTLTEKSMFRVVGFLNAIGFPTQKKKYKFDVNQFRNKVLEIDVADGEPYNGRIRSEVKGYNRVAGSNQASQQEDEFAGLSEFAPGQDPADVSPVADDLPEQEPVAESAPAEVPSAPATAAASEPDDGSVDLDKIDL